MQSPEARLSRFLMEYDDATSDVAASKFSTFDTNIQRWFEVIDEEDLTVAKIIKDLEKRVDFEDWYCKETERNSGIGGDLKWPSGRENRLAMQLLAFRAMAEKEPDLLNFHRQFMDSSVSLMDSIVFEVMSQVFQPMARDLRKHVERMYFDPEIDIEALIVPASDRTVPINHNSTDYADAVAQLAKLEELILKGNDFPSVDERDRTVAEVSAIQRVLKAARIRVDLAIALCRRTLSSVAKKFADLVVGKIAGGLLALIGKLTGLW